MDHSESLQSIKPQWLGILAVATMAVILRPAATSIGPVLDELQKGLGLSAGVAGALTALPCFSFALIGLVANRLVPKFGLVGALLLASGLVSVGTLARVFTGSWAVFLVLSFMALAGMAIGNILLPAFIKSSFPASSARMSTVYTAALALGALLPTIFASPLNKIGGEIIGPEGGWRLALGIWALLGVASFLVWLAVRSKCHMPRRVTVSQGAVPLRRLIGSPTVLGLTLFFGIQSMQAYTQFGWIAQIYRDGGLDQDLSALMVTIIAVGGLPAGLIMPRIVAGKRGLRPLIALYSVLLAVGYLGIAFAPTTAPWLWALALSISGFCFPTALALIIDRTQQPEITSAVSAFVQSFGYLFATLGPLFVGLAFQSLHNWRPILLALAATSLIMFTAGMVASRPTVVDDEIAAKP